MRSRLPALIVIAVVAATFIAGLVVGAQRDDRSGPVDLVVLNGRVFTGAGQEPAEALAVRGNEIVRVGTNRDMKRLAGAATKVIDAHGGTVLPGFIDGHVHFVSGGLGIDRVNLLDAEIARRHQREDPRVRGGESRTVRGCWAAAGTTRRFPAACRRGSYSTNSCPTGPRT